MKHLNNSCLYLLWLCQENKLCALTWVSSAAALLTFLFSKEKSPVCCPGPWEWTLVRWFLYLPGFAKCSQGSKRLQQEKPFAQAIGINRDEQDTEENWFSRWVSNVVQPAPGTCGVENELVLFSHFPLLGVCWFLIPRKGHYGDRQVKSRGTSCKKLHSIAKNPGKPFGLWVQFTLLCHPLERFLFAFHLLPSGKSLFVLPGWRTDGGAVISLHTSSWCCSINHVIRIILGHGNHQLRSKVTF